MNFPQFRKYKNNLSYFKLESYDHFVEYKKYGKTWEKIEFTAKILPDRVFIADMLLEDSPYWDVIDEEEFEFFLNSIG